MRELLPDLERLEAGGNRVGRAVVTSVWGSSPRPPGAVLLATSDGRMAGSVSGGCVEAATVAAIGEAIQSGQSKLVGWTVSQERAWEVGLACGGSIQLLIEPSVRPELRTAASSAAGTAVATVLEGAASGTSLAIDDDGTELGCTMAADLATHVRPKLVSALERLASETVDVEHGGATVPVLLEVFPRRPTLIMVGAVHITESLVPLAKELGYRTVVMDGRAAFLTRERFPTADDLVLAWPEEGLGQVGIDKATCVCVLTHDPKFDEPALEIALRSPAVYVGAIGSRKTQATRREQLRSKGFTNDELARLRGPVGLDLGGRHPAETALAILAEITAVRFQGRGGALTGT